MAGEILFFVTLIKIVTKQKKMTGKFDKVKKCAALSKLNEQPHDKY